MMLSEFLKERGAAVRLARAIGAYESDLRRWASGKRSIPIRWCVLIEEATGSAVTRKDLRPNDYADIWPELTDAPKEGV